MTNAPLHSQPGPKRLRVVWSDQSWSLPAVRSASPLRKASSRWSLKRTSLAGLRFRRAKHPGGSNFHYSKFTIQKSKRAFTILEMLVVVTIIGFMAALALPHLSGMTKANSMTTALQQLLNDCALGRQLAMSRRTTVYMVFVPPISAAFGSPTNDLNSYSNLLTHQYGAYALVSLRSVGDQPGQSFPQYLTEWKPLPDGVFIAPWMFTSQTVRVYSTNTLSYNPGKIVNGLPLGVNQFIVSSFPTNSVPFPAADAMAGGISFKLYLPYIGFSPLGQLTGQLNANTDEYIPLDRGRVLYTGGAATAIAMESPSGNSTNNCNLIHIDWLTARAKIEHNQMR
jgi:prepilin-type N-terminal cleavage/methylation domain-containing protein